VDDLPCIIDDDCQHSIDGNGTCRFEYLNVPMYIYEFYSILPRWNAPHSRSSSESSPRTIKCWLQGSFASERTSVIAFS
jgi:hypothetical protein